MVDGDADCIEILTQVAAVTHALEAAALMLVDQHLRDCLQRGAATTPVSYTHLTLPTSDLV